MRGKRGRSREVFRAVPKLFTFKNEEDFTFKHLLLFEMCTREICEKFIYKHSETIACVNLRILRTENAKFTGYCF